MRKIIFILFMVNFLFVNGQELRVGLLRTIKIRSVTLSLHQGSYTLYGDSTFETKFTSGTFTPLSGKVKVKLSSGLDYVFKEVRIASNTSNSSSKVKSNSPSSRTHYYKDDFELTSNGSRIELVNLVAMDNYLPGVIESEGGGGRHLEYYKVQALMSRTYALKNKKRHAKEGFNVCDGVHCQAYHNMLRHTPKIQDAVALTKGEVMSDYRGKLVTSYFSANCGGQTCDASYVWNTSVHYLETFRDTFCIHTKQATWKKEIDKSAWCGFIKKEYGVDCSSHALSGAAFHFTQQSRKAFYIHPSLGIPLRDLRKKFRLRSTFFDVALEGSKVVLSGRGFGHGVGLCQEGAMNMAKQGFTYKQIANYYFSNVKVFDFYKKDFFNQEEVSDN